MTILLMIGILLVVLLALVVFAIAPARIDNTVKSAFSGVNYAHRGLHSEDRSIPENSIAAFRLAAQSGYGVELDVQLSRDGQVMVFHDDDLARVCNRSEQVDELDADVLRSLPLMNSDERIPLFTEVLDVLGTAPVIVELKTGRRNDELCKKTLDILRENGVNYCVESFDPRIVAWFRKSAPDVLRGQLVTHPSDYDGQSKFTSFLLGNLLLNCLSRPHFIARSSEARMTLTSRICRMLRPMWVVWTLRPADRIAFYESTCDGIIFEYYLPDPHFGGGKTP